ncbi:MAG TPA: hypothetical protein VM077_05855 [Candidatus Limnocylindrales bacterium]|nr:hypothetical protein [Candidatus Limnocylindrales bacterium]
MPKFIKKQKKLIKKIIILLVLFIAAFSVPSILKNKLAEKPNYKIILGDSGFSSSMLTIPLGSTVTFEIEGKQMHWPASNDHPTHENYPEKGGCLGSKLDACRGLQKGEKYSFVFDKKGAFGMHDHLLASSTMVIRVKSEYKKSIDTVDLDQSIRDQEIIKKTAENDPRKAWGDLKKKYIINGKETENPHQLAHFIGHKAFEKYKFSGLDICDDTFAFGCYHGVTEKMLQSIGLSGIKTIEGYCEKRIPKNESQNVPGCTHGIGHGLASWHNFEIDKPLADCDLLKSIYRVGCYDGVFMEFVMSVPKYKFSQNNPWNFCIQLPARHHLKCGRFTSNVLVWQLRGALPKMAGICKNAPLADLKSTCIIELSHRFYYVSSGDEEKIRELCSVFNKKDSEICVIYAINRSGTKI